MILDN